VTRKTKVLIAYCLVSHEFACLAVVNVAMVWFHNVSGLQRTHLAVESRKN